METITLQANGLSFAVDEIGSGDTVALLLHGFPEARQAWRSVSPGLAGLGWRVLAPDLRGYGDSDRPKDRSAYRIPELVADVAGLFHAAGARRRILVAHDWGGVVAWATALSGRVSLDGLVILNAPHPKRYALSLKEGPMQWLRSSYIGFYQLPALPEMQMTAFGGRFLPAMLKQQSKAFSAELLEVYRRNILRPGAATAMLNYYRANFSGMRNAGLASRTLDIPTLLLWGLEDPFLDRRLADGNEAFISDLTVEKFAGVNHWIEHEAPERVVAAIGDWARSKGLA